MTVRKGSVREYPGGFAPKNRALRGKTHRAAAEKAGSIPKLSISLYIMQ